MMIKANGVTLHATESGAGDTALVFLHYWGGTAQTWQPVIDALPMDVRMIALDARGWGRSDRPVDGYDIATLAGDVEAAIGALALDRYVLVGHSMGGKVAQLLASRRPAGLAGLILVAPSPAQGKQLAAAERDGMMSAYANADAAGWTIDNVLSERALSPDLRQKVIAGSVEGAPAAKAAWPASVIAEDVSADLARIDVPVLVIGGEKDKVDSVEMLRSIVMPSLPGAVLAVIPGVGHLLPLEAPVDVARHIAHFLAGGPGGGRHATPTPEDIAPAFDAALNRGDLDGVMALFHPKAIMRMTDGTVVADGSDSLRAAISGLLTLRPSLHNRVRRVLVSDEAALLLLDWEIHVTPPGQEAIVERGTATQIAERGADGNWRLRIANPLGIV